MFHKLPTHSQGSFPEAIPITNETELDDPIHVCRERKFSKRSNPNKMPINAPVSLMPIIAPVSLMYSRMKEGEKSKKGQYCLSRFEPEIEILDTVLTESHVCNRETDASNPERTNEFPVAQASVSDGMLIKTCVHKTRDVDSVNDSCSSSKSNSELALASMKTEADEASECSSSGVMAVEDRREDISAKYICISILRNSGLLEGAWPTRTGPSVEEDIDIDSSSSCSLLCKICSRSETVLKMLICDKCEDAFHTYCCNVQIKEAELEDDDWLCPSCFKKKGKILKEIIKRKPAKINNSGKYIRSSSKSEANPIELMLRDSEPYTTGVRIGRNFQADVPDWSGPIIGDASPIGEPLEIDPSELNANMVWKISSIGNWLQCRDEGVDGTICGKWRRAPLFEVQTDDWDCYCCIRWDPSHADCAVPQELETDEIMKQLKYIEKLRPRLEAKRRKLEGAKHGGSQHSPETSAVVHSILQTNNHW